MVFSSLCTEPRIELLGRSLTFVSVSMLLNDVLLLLLRRHFRCQPLSLKINMVLNTIGLDNT